ncbi:MAG: SDR family NAD(P)-dependent oxidoreductase, partial [Acidimicrobiia bacterium]|nr:SDR family NAD(P)-dependent oxidoreductase [Acidimicrobiia bacterium]
MTTTLQGRVAVVTGASRGIGKGIALELGAAGAIVYLTARSVEPGPIPGTVGETVAEIEALGGTAVGVACDHHDDAQVAALFARVEREHSRLDVLVNNVYSAIDLAPWLGQPFWELPVAAWDQVIDIGVRSHYVASVFATPMLLAAERGIIVNVSSSGSTQYAHNVVYGVGKAALDKMTADMAHELESRGVAVVSVWPGLVRTEIVELGARRTDDGRSVLDLPGEGTFDLDDAETPRFVGRAVVALATDPGVMERSGTTPTVAA